jgi:hypothetical protein
VLQCHVFGHLVPTGTRPGTGTINWWGISPAVDLLENVRTPSMTDTNAATDDDAKVTELPEDVCVEDGGAAADGSGVAATALRQDILIAGAGDVRHILKTMARARRRPAEEIHFWIAEPCVPPVPPV